MKAMKATKAMRATAGNMLKLGAVWSLASLTACVGVVGNGRNESEPRPTPTFTSIDANTELDVVVMRDDTTSIVVTTDANLVPLITTQVIGSTLHIDQVGSFDPRTPSVITVRVPDLDSIDHGGSGPMEVSGFSEPSMHFGNDGSGHVTASIGAGTLDLASDGSGSMTIEGDATALTADVRGSGSLDATQLTAHAAVVTLGGSGSAKIVAVGDATLSTSGSGSIHARLDDGDAWLSVTGSGSILWSGTAHVVAQDSSTGSGSIVHE